MKYNAPVASTDPNAAYVNANASQGIRGSSPPAESIEFPQREILNAITGAGLTPSNLDLTQLWQAIQRSSNFWVVDQGSANTIVINPTKVALAYAPGMMYVVKVAVGNTGATTVNVSGLGARSLVRVTGSALSAGDIVSGGAALIVFDGTQFQLLATSPLSTAEQTLWHGGIDTGTTNNIVATVTPGISAYDQFLPALILIAHTNTGATTINLNGLGVKNLTSVAGSALTAGMITAGCLALVAYDGTQFELLSVLGTVGGGGGSGLLKYFVAVKSATVTSPPGSPATGDTYLIPAGATGAWSGLTNQITQWTGSSWSTVDMPVETMVGVADVDDFWKRTGSGWRSIFATLAETQAGVATNLAVTPADILNMRSIQGPLRPYWLAVNSVTVTTPPGSPTLGDTYLVPSGATGAWSGLTNQLVQWNGSTWLNKVYPTLSFVGVEDTGDLWQQTMSGQWRSIWATPAEALAGTSTILGITPADLSYVLSHLLQDETTSDLFFYGSF